MAAARPPPRADRRRPVPCHRRGRQYAGGDGVPSRMPSRAQTRSEPPGPPFLGEAGQCGRPGQALTAGAPGGTGRGAPISLRGAGRGAEGSPPAGPCPPCGPERVAASAPHRVRVGRTRLALIPKGKEAGMPAAVAMRAGRSCDAGRRAVSCAEAGPPGYQVCRTRPSRRPAGRLQVWPSPRGVVTKRSAAGPGRRRRRCRRAGPGP